MATTAREISAASTQKQLDPEKPSSVSDDRASLDKYEHGLSSPVDRIPLSEFSETEIKSAWRKVDMHILPVAVLLYLSSYIDRYVTELTLCCII